MALLHKAQLSPTKLELIAAWLPTRPWYVGPARPEPTRLAAARFDDPAGAVGVETLLLGVDGRVWQVPLTYRGAPIEGAEAFLVGTTRHSVLGQRWVYDATGDPVYAAQLAAVIRDAGHEAVEEIEADGVRTRREADLRLTGGGADLQLPGTIVDVRDIGDRTVITTGTATLVVHRQPAQDALGPALTGRWPGQDVPLVLAHVQT